MLICVNMDQEIFTCISAPYNGHGFTSYEISNLGNIRNIKTGRMITPGVSGGGYLRANLMSDNSKRIKVYAHRLLFFSFFPSTNPNFEIDHIDDNKTNNNINNLRALSKKEHAQKNNKQGNRWHNQRSRPVEQRNLHGVLLHTYRSLSEAALICGIDVWRICQCCRKKEKDVSGFMFNYAGNEDLAGEDWITIDFAPGYRVSNFGRIRFPNGRMTYGSIHGGGYRRVYIKGLSHLVHRIVASAFLLQKDSNCNLIDHINGNKYDNKACNLQWVDAPGNAKEMAKKISATNLVSLEKKYFISINDAARSLGILRSGIQVALRGKIKQSGGYSFSYE